MQKILYWSAIIGLIIQLVLAHDFISLGTLFSRLQEYIFRFFIAYFLFVPIWTSFYIFIVWGLKKALSKIIFKENTIRNFFILHVIGFFIALIIISGTFFVFF